MPHVVKDRVKETSATTGTGTFTLSGAPTGFQTFSSAIGNTNTTYYAIDNGSQWEVGIGTVGAGTLSRDTVLESSSAGAKVDFSAGTKTVFCTYPAEESVDLDTAQTLTNKTLSGSVLNDGYTEEVYAVVDAAGVALSPTNGSIQTWTLGASRTPTQGTWAAGQSMTLMIDDGSAFSVTWTSIPVTWVGGSPPTLATSGFTVIELWEVGTTIYGALVGYVA